MLGDFGNESITMNEDIYRIYFIECFLWVEFYNGLFNKIVLEKVVLEMDGGFFPQYLNFQCHFNIF